MGYINTTPSKTAFDVLDVSLLSKINLINLFASYRGKPRLFEIEAVKKNGNAPIIARITIDQVVAQFNTKLEINPAHWSVKLGKASGRTAEAVHINSMLESIHSTVPQQD